MKTAVIVSLSALSAMACASAQNSPPATTAPSPAPSSTIAAKTAGMERRDGFIPVYIDNKQGKLLLELPSDSMRALMFVTLATGLGSNPIGLDRGSGGDSYVARFDRNGERVLVVFENWNYRSSASDNPAHVRTVMEAFPPSTPGSLPNIAQEWGRM